MPNIEFKVKNFSDILQKINLSKIKPEKALQYEIPFEILIDGKVYFSDEYFPLLDFAKFISDAGAFSEQADILYNCIETEENPLIGFCFRDGEWFINSPWELFVCEESFSNRSVKNCV